MRFLAIDTGEKRIGLATCDADETFASPHDTRDRTSGRADAEWLVNLIKAMSIEGVVVGLPLALESSKSGDREADARSFARKLEKALAQAGREIPLFFQDERFSTKEALNDMRSAGVSQRAARDGGGRSVDARAASILLQAFLDKRHESLRRNEAFENEQNTKLDIESD